MKLRLELSVSPFCISSVRIRRKGLPILNLFYLGNVNGLGELELMVPLDAVIATLPANSACLL